MLTHLKNSLLNTAPIDATGSQLPIGHILMVTAPAS